MKRLLASCFGLGRLPLAPGTWGSLPVVIIFAFMGHFHLSGPSITIVMAVLTIAGSIVCVRFAPAAIAATGNTDPREVVADELAGQAVTFLVSPFLAISAVSSRDVWVAAVLGFFLFRLFDIAKPWPVCKLEKLPAGWGVLADDLLAGVFAAIVLQIIIRSWIGG